MRCTRLALASLALAALASADLRAEILVRWDRDDIPPPSALGISTVAVPADRPAALARALSHGYRVFAELGGTTPASKLPPLRDVAGVLVTGSPSVRWLRLLKGRLPATCRVIELGDAAKWPHIRTNWVTKNNDVLQVAGRSAQPWIENNAALLALAADGRPGSHSMLTYRWTPTTVAEEAEGPPLESYLVAIAEAGSFGGDLLLPLHERLQQHLVLGLPEARAAWAEIRRHIAFYDHNFPRRYRRLADIGVMGETPMQSYELMNLLARHNLPFRWIAPSALTGSAVEGLSLLIVLDAPDTRMRGALASFAKAGGTVVLTGARPDGHRGGGSGGAEAWPGSVREREAENRVSYRLGEGRIVQVLAGVPDPDAFALEMRRHLGAARRVIDIWNGITVLTAPYEDPTGGTVLVTALNYAHQPLPVQLRVRGTFSVVQFEAPGEERALLPHRHRDGYTEFVLPALRIGGRVFLSERTDRGGSTTRR